MASPAGWGFGAIGGARWRGLQGKTTSADGLSLNRPGFGCGFFHTAVDAIMGSGHASGLAPLRQFFAKGGGQLKAKPRARIVCQTGKSRVIDYVIKKNTPEKSGAHQGDFYVQ
ncbi:MAG: hypothetical protein V9G14_09605 [Cypionkella sp.]|nr:hypothetical protein [Cypionkella sp.]